MEYVDIYTEEGKPTGEILEKVEAYKRENVWLKGICVCILNSKNQILLQKRAKSKKIDPDLWDILYGHVQHGEDTIHASLREIQEEIGVQVKKENLKSLMIQKEDYTKLGRIGKAYTECFYTKIDKPISEFTIDQEELQQIKWVDYQDLKQKLLMHNPELRLKWENPNTQKWIQSIEEILNKN